MDKDMRKFISRKNRLWTRYMETKDILKYISIANVEIKSGL